MNIEHDLKNERFFLKINEVEAVLLYRKASEDILDFYSTKVPAEAQGQGIAGKLVETAVSYAKTNNYKVKPSCSYVEKYFDKREELKDLRV